MITLYRRMTGLASSLASRGLVTGHIQGLTRNQLTLILDSLDDYIGGENPACFVDTLDG